MAWLKKSFFSVTIIRSILSILILFSNDILCEGINLTSVNSTTTTTTTYSPPAAITPEDIITVQNKHLYKKSTNTKFYLKGIAFPDPPPSIPYNAQSWIDILHQLQNLQTPYNAVRIYRMNPSTDYSEFLNEAANLGIYVMVPLTSAQGNGVMDRNKSPRKCYPRSLFQYGISCICNYVQYPNVVAGLIGNEVMNSIQTWVSAPCVKAYGRDLKAWMKQEVKKGAIPRVLPLVYAAQDTGLGTVLPVQTMKLTMDYLMCTPNAHSWEKKTQRQQKLKQLLAVSETTEKPTKHTTTAKQTWFDKSEEMVNDVDDEDEGMAIDIFGINVESWCSSSDTYKNNADGTTGTYYQLHQGLQNTSIPILFSEMGCAHDLYDGKMQQQQQQQQQQNTNGPMRKKGDRTWSQIPIVLHEMSDTWAGFFAYAYEGSPEFVMFDNGPWDGIHTLTPTADFYSWKEQLSKMMVESNSTWEEEDEDDTMNDDVGMRGVKTTALPPLCSIIESELKETCGIELQDFRRIPTFVRHEDSRTVEYIIMWMVSLIIIGWVCLKTMNVRQKQLSRKEYELIV